MFPVSRPFRQGLATLALVVLTVLPTAFMAAWAWRIHRPGHIRDVEIELGRQLGLQVTIEAVRYPRPGEVVFRGIVLRHEEPRGGGLTEIARADLVRSVRGDRELTLHAENLKLRGSSPRQALVQVGSWLQKSTAIPYERVNLAAPNCRVELGRESLGYDVQEVAGEFVLDRTNPTLRLAYRLAETGAGTRCELTLGRDRSAEPIRTALSFKTVEGVPLPARVLEVFFETREWLGPRARVEGSLALSQRGAGEWEAEFQGNLLEVDLAALVGNRFPHHRLAGPARVAIQSARWGDRPGQGPGWIEAKGELVSSQGAIGVDLCNALAREMRFRLSPRMARLDPRKTELEFRSLGLAFDMRSNGEIHLSGSLGSEFTPDAVLVSGSAPLVFAPDGTASVHGLIKTLFPVADAAQDVMVPLTNESRVLLCLPVPPDVATRAGRTLGGN
jgi:hypothetical protein